MGASELLKELVSGDLNLAQDAAEQPRANNFAGVNRNKCKSHPLKHHQQLFARDRWIAAHASTATR